jgi:hypothetical protein
VVSRPGPGGRFGNGGCSCAGARTANESAMETAHGMSCRRFNPAHAIVLVVRRKILMLQAIPEGVERIVVSGKEHVTSPRGNGGELRVSIDRVSAGI